MPVGSALAGVTLEHRDLAQGRDAYLIDAQTGGGVDDGAAETDPAAAAVPFHVILGGARPAYALATRGDLWPARFPEEDPLRLIPLEPLEPGERVQQRRRVEVLARDGSTLVLRLPDYPLGGLNGGHVVALRTIGGSSYTVSLHFKDGPPSLTAEAALVGAIARGLGRRE